MRQVWNYSCSNLRIHYSNMLDTCCPITLTDRINCKCLFESILMSDKRETYKCYGYIQGQYSKNGSATRIRRNASWESSKILVQTSGKQGYWMSKFDFIYKAFYRDGVSVPFVITLVCAYHLYVFLPCQTACTSITPAYGHTCLQVYFVLSC